MKLNDDVYKFLKWLGLLALPGLATFWGVVGVAWGIPHTTEVVTTLSATAVLVGTLIGVSTAKYNKDKEKEEDNNDEETL